MEEINKLIFENYQFNGKINCPCGKTILKRSFKGHITTKNHIASIKQNENGTYSIEKKMDGENTKPFYLYELFELIKKKSIQELLLIGDNDIEKGHLFEAINDILVKLGYIIQSKEYKVEHLEGNLRTDTCTKINDIKRYFKTTKINNSNKNGPSDITMKINDTYIFSSVKCVKDEKKTIEDYDIDKIISNITKTLYEKWEIILFVNDDTIVKRLINKSHMKEERKKKIRVIGIKYIEEKYELMKREFIEKNLHIENIDEIYSFEKKKFEGRLHQKFFTRKLINQWQQGKRYFLYGWKPRSGKTYGCGDLINELGNIINNLNILIITPAPNETISQFMDMFNDYIEFKKFNVLNMKDGNSFKNINGELNDKGNNIIVVSKQLIDDYIGVNRIELKIDVDLFIFDECHWSGTTEKSKRIIETYCNDETIKLFLSATYNKPLMKYNLDKGCCYFWTMEDERLCKKRNVEELEKKHEIKLIELLQGNAEEQLKEYDKMPEQIILTYLFEQQKYEEIMEKTKGSKYGYSMKTLLSIKDGKFEYPDEVKRILEFITGSNKEHDFPNGDKSFYGRIKTHAQQKGGRTLNGEFTTQLWYMPFGKGQKIDGVSKEMKRIMLKNCILKNYEIMILNSTEGKIQKDLKKIIENEELKAKNAGKDGLIILAGMKCVLGITLKRTDIVMLFNYMTSSDILTQMMYRCMSETEDGNKPYGYVVDFELSRVLTTILDYSVSKNLRGSVKDKIQYLFEHNLINIDIDMLNTKITQQTIIDRLFEVWNRNSKNTMKRLLNGMKQELNGFETLWNDIRFKKLLNAQFIGSEMMNKLKNSEISKTYMNDDDEKQHIKSGEKKTIERRDEQKLDKENKEQITHEEHEELLKKKIDFVKRTIPDIVIISVISAYAKVNDNFPTKFDELMELIKRDDNISNIVYYKLNEMYSSTKNQENIFNDKYISFVSELIKFNSDLYNKINDNILKIKTCIIPLINEPKKLIKFINSIMKPRKDETKKYGEVFTPLNLVKEMLNKLNETYQKENKVSIFTKSELKWFDPANGLGNFIVILYYKLMSGLKEIIPNQEERKKHILENMIYVSELNESNVYLYKMIVDPDKRYRLNINEGDSLTLDIREKWGIDKFDVVIGNPPFQTQVGLRDETHKKPKTHPLWNIFVKKVITYIKNNGYLIFIHPSGWRNISGNFRDVYELIMNKNLKYLNMNDFDKGSKIFGVGTNFDYYVLQNNTQLTKTTISDIENEIYEIDTKHLKKFRFIPSGGFKLFEKLIVLNEDENVNIEHVNVLHDFSIYETRKLWMSHIITPTHIYPCSYTITKKNGLKCFYSSKKGKHFDTSKVIWSNGLGTYPIIDDKGEYGLTQFSYAIVDDNVVLSKIRDALNNKQFIKLMTYVKFTNNKYNYKIIELMRKDFWKEFV